MKASLLFSTRDNILKTLYWVLTFDQTVWMSIKDDSYSSCLITHHYDKTSHVLLAGVSGGFPGVLPFRPTFRFARLDMSEMILKGTLN